MAIFSDELNHASIIDGARLAVRAGAGGGGGGGGPDGASTSSSSSSSADVALHVYRHNDLEHLEVRDNGNGE